MYECDAAKWDCRCRMRFSKKSWYAIVFVRSRVASVVNRRRHPIIRDLRVQLPMQQEHHRHHRDVGTRRNVSLRLQPHGHFVSSRLRSSPIRISDTPCVVNTKSPFLCSANVYHILIHFVRSTSADSPFHTRRAKTCCPSRTRVAALVF